MSKDVIKTRKKRINIWLGISASIVSMISVSWILYISTISTTDCISFFWVLTGILSQLLWVIYGLKNN